MNVVAPVSPWNLANAITTLRILLVPLFIWFLFESPDKGAWQRWVALALFILAISTDGVDGAIARRKGLVTNLGKILDPIADKALIGGALVALSILGELPWWATVAILVRELGITAYRFIVIRKRVVAASGGGKLKTILQSITVGLFLSPFDVLLGDWVFWVEDWLLLTTVALTLYTGAQYLWAAAKAKS
jgi:CDP-diacylglycerol--glycerol-3-phosphate 3-phosphatidyltransferase